MRTEPSRPLRPPSARAPPSPAPRARPRSVHCACTMRPTITHALFDVDGLLLDTESIYSAAQVAVLDDLGIGGDRFTPAVKRAMMGRPALAAAQAMIDALQCGDVINAADFITRREAVLHDLFPDAQLMPGAERVVRHLVQSGTPIAVATSSHRRHFELKTAKHQDLFSTFNTIVTSCDPALNGRGKPDPAIFNLAAERLGATPSTSVLVFEDADIGVAAGRAAGMSVVHVLDARWADTDGKGSGACQTLASLEEWRPEEWGLPAF